MLNHLRLPQHTMWLNVSESTEIVVPLCSVLQLCSAFKPSLNFLPLWDSSRQESSFWASSVSYRHLPIALSAYAQDLPYRDYLTHPRIAQGLTQSRCLANTGWIIVQLHLPILEETCVLATATLIPASNWLFQVGPITWSAIIGGSHSRIRARSMEGMRWRRQTGCRAGLSSENGEVRQQVRKIIPEWLKPRHAIKHPLAFFPRGWKLMGQCAWKIGTVGSEIYLLSFRVLMFSWRQRHKC